jgi:DNA-binding CsgD family transcriptional regulator/tetratricopeptide (TPR) repeat protein
MASALSALRGASLHGTSSSVVISGPAGIGKTALLAEICEHAARMKIRVGRSKCDPIEQVWPGAPVIAALRAGQDPLTTAEQYEQIARVVSEPLLLADRIASRLEDLAAAHPLLVAIDDLQWADRVSRFLLRSLLSRLAGLPVVWMFASRDDPIRIDLSGQDIVRFEHVQLAPLTTQDLAAMARDRLGRVPDERTRRYLHATGGNPFLATQVIDSLARSAAGGESDTVAGEFATAMARQLAGLPSPARELVELVAAADRPLPVRDAFVLMPGLCSCDGQDGLAGAVGSGLITVSADALAFRHDLVRETVYALLAGHRARQLHARLAEYHLSVLGEPLVAASHARAAATPGDLASALILVSAAETLARTSAEDAGDLAALAFGTVLPAQPEWLEVSRRCLSVLCQAQHAAQAITVAGQILARVDDANLAAQVETEAASALWLSGRVHDLASRIEKTLRSGDLDTLVTVRLRAAYALARTRTLTGEPAAREAASAVEQARDSGDREALTLAVQAAGEAARNQGCHQVALRHFRELRALTGAPYLAEEITALQFLDRYNHAQALLDQAHASCATTQAVLPGITCAQMWQDFNLGRLDDADAGARTLMELARQLGTSLHLLDAITVRIGVALLRGETEIAAAQLRLADTLTDADEAIRNPGITVMRGWLAAGRGDLPAARDTLRPVLQGADQGRSYWPLWPCWNRLFFQVGIGVGDDTFTASCLDVAEANAAGNPGVASFEGVALNLRGLGKQDLDILAEAAQVLDRSPRPILRAVGAESYGHALLAAGRRSEGLAQLDRAWDEYHHMGARAFRSDVQRAMRQAGARRTKWTTAAAAPTTGWASLTGAERRVATLISEGHTNKSAASALGVSINTVGTHLRAVFAKLGVQSRVQLANRLASHTSKAPDDSMRRPILSPRPCGAHHPRSAGRSPGDWSDRPATSLVRCTRELTPSFSKTWRR